MPRASAAIWQKMVFVPWPISSAGHEDADAAFMRSFQRNYRFQITLSGTGKARAVHEGGEADALAGSWKPGSEMRRRLSFGVVVGLFEGPVDQKAGEVYFFADDLAGGGGFAFTRKVAWRRSSSGPHRTCDLIQMPMFLCSLVRIQCGCGCDQHAHYSFQWFLRHFSNGAASE